MSGDSDVTITEVRQKKCFSKNQTYLLHQCSLFTVASTLRHAIQDPTADLLGSSNRTLIVLSDRHESGTGSGSVLQSLKLGAFR